MSNEIDRIEISWEYLNEELAIFWQSPYGNGKEKIATFWWPTHPPECTNEVEDLFESLAARITVSNVALREKMQRDALYASLNDRWNLAACNAGIAGSEYVDYPERVFDRVNETRGGLKRALVAAKAEAQTLREKLEAAEKERDELQQSFDLRYAADMRAIKRWQEETGRTLVWPDHADLCVRLMKERDTLREALVKVNFLITSTDARMDAPQRYRFLTTGQNEAALAVMAMLKEGTESK
jgi:hypothetical protein